MKEIDKLKKHLEREIKKYEDYRKASVLGKLYDIQITANQAKIVLKILTNKEK